MAVERLDKLISQVLNISRTDAKVLVRKGKVKIDGVVVLKSDVKCDTDKSEIVVNDTTVNYKQHTYIMMNKPAGVVCTTDSKDTNVIDILPDSLKTKGLFPVGRLDKDTTGLLIITNDGDFAHKIISPGKNINKSYIAKLAQPLTESAKAALTKEMTLADGTVVSPAQINVLNGDATEVKITISEGKYHQVKRMFAAVGNKVTSLCRISIGSLTIDDAPECGNSREMTEFELENLMQNSDVN